MRNWMYEHQFVIHTSYHSGVEMLIYPWGYRPALCPDNDNMYHAATAYVSASTYPVLTYGAAYEHLYPVNGSSMDTYYGLMGSVGWTMEISEDKQPPTSQLLTYYNYNLPSMIAMTEYSGYGLQGTVTDAETGEPIAATIFVDTLYPCFTDPAVGDYHKYLISGSYSITAIASGYQSMTKNNIMVTSLNTTTCDFGLVPNDEHYAYRVAGCRIPNNNTADEGNTKAVIGPADQVHYSIGVNGWIIVDMQHDILNGPGNEIRVVEDDDEDEGYDCYAGSTIDGPWQFLGQGSGTTDFDFENAMLDEARFIMIRDDGGGTPQMEDAGFDLDAIKILDQPMIVALKMSYYIDDASGNNDGRLDPNEKADLVITLKNTGRLTADNLSANLNYDSSWVFVDNPDEEFGTIPFAGSATVSFSINADQLAPYEEVIQMVLNLRANDDDFTQSIPFGINIGNIFEDWETGNFNKFELQQI